MQRSRTTSECRAETNAEAEANAEAETNAEEVTPRRVAEQNQRTKRQSRARDERQSRTIDQRQSRTRRATQREESRTKAQRCRGAETKRRKGAELQRRNSAKAKTGRVPCREKGRETLAGTLARSAPIQGAQKRVVRVVIVATRTPRETHIQRASNAAHWSDSHAQLSKARACTTPLTRQSVNTRRM